MINDKNINTNHTDSSNKNSDASYSEETLDRKYMRWVADVPVFEWTNEQRSPTFSHLKMREINCGPHFHSHMEIYILHSNEQEVTINGETKTLHGGDIGIADSMDVHSYKYHSDSYSDVFLIPAIFLNYYNKYKGNGHLQTNFIVNRPVIYQQFVNILHSVDDFHNPVSQRGAINTLLGLIIDTCHISPDDRPDISRMTDNEFARHIMEYIAENITENISQDAIAKEFHYSTSYFANKFKAIFGFSFSQYLNNARLSRFFELSRENPYASLTSLIMDSGFKSTTSFYRRFTEKTRMTPAQFMEEIRAHTSNKSTPPPAKNDILI